MKKYIFVLFLVIQLFMVNMSLAHCLLDKSEQLLVYSEFDPKNPNTAGYVASIQSRQNKCDNDELQFLRNKTIDRLKASYKACSYEKASTYYCERIEDRLYQIESEEQLELFFYHPYMMPLQLDKALIVTHASFSFDFYGVAARGIDQTIDRLKDTHSVAYLVFNPNVEVQYNQYQYDRNPDYAFQSGGGEHNIQVIDTVTIVGGYWGACHWNSIESVVHNFHFNKDLTINLPMEAIFGAFGSRVLTLRQMYQQYFFKKKFFHYIVSSAQRANEFNLAEYRYILKFNGKNTNYSFGEGNKKIILNLE